MKIFGRIELNRRRLWSEDSFPIKLELGLFVGATAALSLYKIFVNDWNNYRIFYFSFEHLRQGLQLYTLYPDQYFDLFKYSPSFAALMSPFSFFSLEIGAILWNILGVLSFWTGIRRFFPTSPPRGLLCALLLPELIGQIQNFQSNALLAGILLHGFADFQKQRWWSAGLLISLAFHVKLFGAALGALSLLWGGRAFLREGVWSLFFLVLVSLTPLFWVTPSELLVIYKDWLELLKWDQGSSQGASFMGVFRSFFGLTLPNLGTQLVSFLIMAGSWIIHLNRSQQTEAAALSRLRGFSLLLVWMIVFNHKSESPTFIIGMTGFALWFLNFTPRTSPPRSKWKSPLLWITLVFVSVLSSDLIPPNWKTQWIQPLEMKVWPLLALWFCLVFRDYYDFFKSRGSRTAAV